jgi:hypothetical protein
MKHFITAVGAAIVTALILPAAAQSLSKDIAGAHAFRNSWNVESQPHLASTVPASSVIA